MYEYNTWAITSAKIMFSLCVCLFVSRIMQKQQTNFHKSRSKGGTQASEYPLDFDGTVMLKSGWS